MHKVSNTISAGSDAILRAVMACGPSTSRHIAEATGIGGQGLGGHIAGLLGNEFLREKKVEGRRTRYWLGPEFPEAIGGIDLPGIGYVDLSSAPRSWFDTTLTSPSSLPHIDGCVELAMVLGLQGGGRVLNERMLRILERILGERFATSVTGHCPDVVLLRDGHLPRVYEYERTDKNAEQGDPILEGWGETRDVAVVYLTPRQKATWVVRRHVDLTETADAITVIPMIEGEFPSREVLVRRGPKCRGKVAQPHNQGGRPRATARTADKKARTRS
jgi:hypothetical protein